MLGVVSRSAGSTGAAAADKRQAERIGAWDGDGTFAGRYSVRELLQPIYSRRQIGEN